MLSSPKTTDLLFQPFTFKRGMQVRNSVAMAPMTTWSSNDDLSVSDEEVRYYEARVGGVGLVVTGCSHVTPNGQGFTDEFACCDDSFILSLRKLATAAKSGGALAILQIFHGGNKALAALVPNGDIVSASTMAIEATPFTPAATSRALTESEIKSIILDFGQATRRAIEAGFDGVELHGAHGFLLQNFLSPYFNQRTDQWGGSLENRLRFPLAVVQEVQRSIQEHATGPFLIGYRISPDEPQEGGLRIADVYELIDRLIALDIDYLHVSLPSVLTTKPVDSQNDQLVIEGIVAQVRERLPVIAAGHLRTPTEARQALALGLAMIALGQALVVTPTWLELAASGREDEINGVLQPATVVEKRIPGKLWGIIQVAIGWFTVAEV